MAFRFWRRVQLAPGVTLNLSKSMASLSLGPRGAKYTISPRGNRVTAGLPGTGLFYTIHQRRPGSGSAAPPIPTRDRLSLGFFQRLLMPADERVLVEGLKALNDGEETTALAAFKDAADLPDAAWLAGMLLLKREDFGPARGHLEAALAGLDRLGSQLDKYGIAAQVTFPVTPEVDAHARPQERGTRLALVEVAQLEGRIEDAFEHLERLVEIEPQDPVVLLSFVELALEQALNPAQLEEIVALTTSIENETPVHTAILLYRGRALAQLALPDAAIDTLTLALRRRKDRSDVLLRQIRYERALLFDQVGRRAQARRELERVYAEDPGFEDVRARLGLG